MRRPRADDGSASLWVIGCGALLVVMTYAAVLGGQAVLVRHRAESAADLAALAGAGRIGVGGDPCAAAARVAAANGAQLRSCRPEVAQDGRSGTVLVGVAITVRFPGVGLRAAVARARAERAPLGERAPPG